MKVKRYNEFVDDLQTNEEINLKDIVAGAALTAAVTPASGFDPPTHAVNSHGSDPALPAASNFAQTDTGPAAGPFYARQRRSTSKMTCGIGYQWQS